MDLKALEEDKKRNREQRLEFVTLYAQWVKRTPNSEWSRQQRQMIDDVIKNANKVAKEGIKVN